MKKIQVFNIRKDIHYKEIKYLYLSAFPSNERAFFWKVCNSIKRQGFIMHKYLIENEFAGFTIIGENQNLIYFMYFAICENFRNQGLGKQIVNELVINSSKPIMLAAEQPNSEIAKRRIEFYKRNGFQLLDFGIREGDVTYQCLGTSKDIEIKDYNQIVINGFGKLYFWLFFSKDKIKLS